MMGNTDSNIVQTDIEENFQYINPPSYNDNDLLDNNTIQIKLTDAELDSLHYLILAYDGFKVETHSDNLLILKPSLKNLDNVTESYNNLKNYISSTNNIEMFHKLYLNKATIIYNNYLELIEPLKKNKAIKK